MLKLLQRVGRFTYVDFTKLTTKELCTPQLIKKLMTGWFTRMKKPEESLPGKAAQHCSADLLQREEVTPSDQYRSESTNWH